MWYAVITTKGSFLRVTCNNPPPSSTLCNPLCIWDASVQKVFCLIGSLPFMLARREACRNYSLGKKRSSRVLLKGTRRNMQSKAGNCLHTNGAQIPDEVIVEGERNNIQHSTRCCSSGAQKCCCFCIFTFCLYSPQCYQPYVTEQQEELILNTDAVMLPSREITLNCKQQIKEIAHFLSVSKKCLIYPFTSALSDFLERLFEGVCSFPASRQLQRNCEAHLHEIFVTSCADSSSRPRKTQETVGRVSRFLLLTNLCKKGTLRKSVFACSSKTVYLLMGKKTIHTCNGNREIVRQC